MPCSVSHCNGRRKTAQNIARSGYLPLMALVFDFGIATTSGQSWCGLVGTLARVPGAYEILWWYANRLMCVIRCVLRDCRRQMRHLVASCQASVPLVRNLQEWLRIPHVFLEDSRRA